MENKKPNIAILISIFDWISLNFNTKTPSIAGINIKKENLVKKDSNKEPTFEIDKKLDNVNMENLENSSELVYPKRISINHYLISRQP